MLESPFKEVATVHLLIRKSTAQSARLFLLINEADVAGVETDLELRDHLGFQEGLIHDNEAAKHILEFLRLNKRWKLCFSALLSMNDLNNLAFWCTPRGNPHLLLFVEGQLLSIDLILKVQSAPDNTSSVQCDGPPRQFALIEIYENFGSEGCKNKGSAIEPSVFPGSANKGTVLKHENSFSIFHFPFQDSLEKVTTCFMAF